LMSFFIASPVTVACGSPPGDERHPAVSAADRM